MKTGVSFFRSIKTKLSLIVVLTSVLSLGVVGYLSFNLARYGMESAGMGQIKDTLEGGYSLVKHYYSLVQSGKITKKKAFEDIRLFLSGRVKQVWMKVKTTEDLHGCLKLFGYEPKKNDDIKIIEEIILQGNHQIGKFDKNKSMFVITAFGFLRELMEKYNSLNTEEQRKVINSKYKVRIIYDFSTAVIKIRSSGYVWAIKGTPAGDEKGKAYEIFHPSISNLNVWKAKNFKGERVGQKISYLNGKIDTAKPDEIVKYEYLWKNPTDPSARKKIVLMKYFRPWNWVICSGLYEDEFFAKLSEIRRTLIIGAILAAIVSFIITFITVLRFARPVQKAAVIASNIARKDLSTKTKYTKRRDEIGNLMNSITDMQVNLRKIISEMMKASNQMANSSAEISEAAEHLSMGSQSQIESVDEASMAMNKLSDMIEEITNYSRDINEKSKELKGVSENSKKHIDTTIDSMQKINLNSKMIHQILSVISEIAFQTNMLAMNASVEAARAGHHGKGFAVVADEVSSLAKKSTENSKKIEELINTNFSDVKSGTDIVMNAGKAFNTIIEAVQENDNLIKQITQSVMEQKADADDVGKAVETIDDVAQRVGAASEELAGSTTELKKMADDIKELFHEFKLTSNEDNENKS